MTDATIIPVDPVPHPSVFIQDEMDARNWTRDHLAVAMAQTAGEDTPGKCRMMLDAYFIVGPQDDRMRIGDVMAGMLSGAFGVSAQHFLNLEAAWLNDNPANGGTAHDQ